MKSIFPSRGHLAECKSPQRTLFIRSHSVWEDGIRSWCTLPQECFYLSCIISHTTLTEAYPPSLMDVVLCLLLSKVKYIPNILSFFFEDNPLCVNSKHNILPDWFLCKRLPNSKVSEAEKGPL